MKKLNFETITAGLSTLQDALDQNAVIGWDELVEAEVIDFAEKNSYAADDTDEMIRELADQIEVAGLLTPLGVIKEGNRYRLFSGERRYRAITTYLHWKKIPCRIFQGVSPNKAQLMLHMANGARDYTPARKLELYEEYNDLLRRMKENGEFSGPIQQGVAELLNVSDRQVRTYRTMAEQLTREEREAVSSGSLSFREAKETAVERAVEQKQKNKTGTGSGSTPRRKTMKERNARSESWDREKIVQIKLPDPEDDDPHPRLMCDGYGIHCGDSFSAWLPDGKWHDITLEARWETEGPECWYISNPEYRDIKPGHYETVEHWELVPVTVGEVGHWEDVFYTHWVYQCNTCGYRTDTVEEINRHIENSITWVNNKPVGCAGYSMVSSDPEYTGEQYWVVDVPGHIEYQWQAVKEEIWVEEVGHWEYL